MGGGHESSLGLGERHDRLVDAQGEEYVKRQGLRITFAWRDLNKNGRGL